MANSLHIHVRSLEIGDFDFVRDLASRQPNFTVPPPYVLWLLLRIKGSVCLIAEMVDEGQLAYLLALPVEGPTESLFVWQLAAKETKLEDRGVLALLTELRNLVRARHVRTVLFSAPPNSAKQRLIAHYTNMLVAVTPRLISILPASVTSNEGEYRVDL